MTELTREIEISQCRAASPPRSRNRAEAKSALAEPGHVDEKHFRWLNAIEAPFTLRGGDGLYMRRA